MFKMEPFKSVLTANFMLTVLKLSHGSSFLDYNENQFGNDTRKFFCMTAAIISNPDEKPEEQALLWIKKTINSPDINANHALICSLLEVVPILTSTCWSIDAVNWDLAKEVLFFSETLAGYNDNLGEDMRILSILKNYNNLCFYGHEMPCVEERHQVKLLERKPLPSMQKYSFNRIYEYDVAIFTVHNLTICGLPSVIYDSISCLEKRSNNTNSSEANLAVEACLPSTHFKHKYSAMYTYAFVTQSITLILRTFCVFSGLIFKPIRTFPLSIILSLAFAMFIEKIFDLVIVNSNFSIQLCFIVYFIHRWAILALFIWTFIIGFHIFSAFGLRTFDSIEPRQKFLYYSIIAWIVPPILVFLDIIVQNSVDPDSKFHYRYSLVDCRIWSNYSTILFYYLPIIAIYISNFFFFFYSIRKILEIKRDNLRNFTNDDKFHLHFLWRLAGLLGISYIIILIAKTINNSGLLYVAFAVEIIQSLLILIILFTSKRMKHEIQKFKILFKKDERSRNNSRVEIFESHTNYGDSIE